MAAKLLRFTSNYGGPSPSPLSAGEASDVDVMADVDVFAAAMDDFGADDFNINARLLIPVVKKTKTNINARLLIPVVRTAISDRS